ncbi:hypothetical protein ACWGFX_33960 [Streptomyces xanthophaeus]
MSTEPSTEPSTESSAEPAADSGSRRDAEVGHPTPADVPGLARYACPAREQTGGLRVPGLPESAVQGHRARMFGVPARAGPRTPWSSASRSGASTISP